MFSNFYPEANLENINQILEKYGVAVIPDVFQADECENLKNKVFEYLKEEFEIEKPDDYGLLKPISGGILHYYGISLLKEVLDAKTDERVVQIFEKIWDTKELTMSLDGMHIAPPAEQTSRIFFNERTFRFHTDQASCRTTKCCVQGFINLEHTESGDGCLSVLANSHKYHQEFFEAFNIDTHGSDWHVINNSTNLEWFLKKGCECKWIMAPKGSLVLWDSRTFHNGTLPRIERANKDRWRFLIYVCFAPAIMQSKKDRDLLKKAYIENRCTAHWPYNVNVFNRAYDDTKYNSLSDLSERHKHYLGLS
jgi:hypothetical protein